MTQIGQNGAKILIFVTFFAYFGGLAVLFCPVEGRVVLNVWVFLFSKKKSEGGPSVHQRVLRTIANRRFATLSQLSHKILSPVATQGLSGPVRDTPPYRAIPFRDSIAEGGIAPICLVFIGYRAGIAEIPLLSGGIAPPLRECSPRGKRAEKGEGVSHAIGHVETPKTP